MTWWRRLEVEDNTVRTRIVRCWGKQYGDDNFGEIKCQRCPYFDTCKWLSQKMDSLGEEVKHGTLRGFSTHYLQKNKERFKKWLGIKTDEEWEECMEKATNFKKKMKEAFGEEWLTE